MPHFTDPTYAETLDQEDELAHLRHEFVIVDPEAIYLDGNSLGRLPKRTILRMQEAVEQEWGQRLIRGWNDGWFSAPARVGAKIARLIGAASDQVIISDSTSVNLFKLVMAGLRAQRDRHKIVSDDLNFPSDIYVMQSALALMGDDYRLQIVHSQDAISPDMSALEQAVDADTAIVALTHTSFKSGYVYDMPGITSIGHAAGALVLWDLCHSVGAMPLDLSASQVDLAVGCTYKYLNGGPGSPAFLYVRSELLGELANPIGGWFGQEGQFNFSLKFVPKSGIQRFMSGTPPILSLTPVETAVDMILDVGLERLRRKSIRQTEYLIALWEEWLKPLGVTLNSPRDPNVRGSHVSLGHPDGMRIDRALIEDAKVIPDFRYPDNIRLGIAPLYTSFVEIHTAMSRFRNVMRDKTFEKYPTMRPEVT